ncbi:MULTISPECIES: hypothetical protein [Halomonadaceae]|uniref:Uncharacterized protein n=1 Tax=Vreelandella titanicae TaxID=664683 RepID=A0AAP9NLN0_9GAMM|nr:MULTISPECIES: hypothetical protein [Halomonas]QKS24202.1 hypothetical protein FX987_01976 [Halomonas titanicae]
MTNKLKAKLLSFRDQKKQGMVTAVNVRGAGVASVTSKGFMSSRKVTNVVGKINRTKIENFDYT